MKEILVVGGAGYIGSHFIKHLKSKSDANIVILDSFCSGYKEATNGCEVHEVDLSNKEDIDMVFKSHNFSAVVHFAAFIEVGESVKNPSKYYKNNLVNTINLLDCMVENDVKNIVFSSTAATYGNPQYTPIDEKHPQQPINPYGRAKLMVEWVMQDYSVYGLRHVALRYFNACGSDFDGEIGESHVPESHLIPLVLHAISGKRDNITIFGTDYDTPDGTCVRDYVHVNDLAEAHVLALDYLANDGESIGLNLATGTGTSVKEIIETCERVTGKKAPTIVGERRDGDPAFLFASPARAKEVLGWEAQITDLDKIVDSAWKWEQNKKY